MKTGRNDPCHCGSGKKYKYCHFEVDRVAESAARKEAMEAATAEEEQTEAQSDDRSPRDDNGTDSTDTRKDRAAKDGSRVFRDTKGRTTKGQNRISGERTPRITSGAQGGG